MELHSKVKVGISLMLEDEFQDAIAPLLRNNVIEAIDWSVDLGWGTYGIPEWADRVLTHHSENGSLYAHGVLFSPMSSFMEPRQYLWLKNLKEEVKYYKYKHVTEHFGFMTSTGCLQGAPLPCPMTDGSIGVGTQRLAMIQDAAGGIPVGLENLGLALSAEEAWNQGEFIRRLIEPLDGIMLLDVHNLYCLIHNFHFDPKEIMQRYPLERVREIHLSGGSFSTPTVGKNLEPFRRDTHDDNVPEEVFKLLELALELCPNVEVVIFERLGDTIRDQADKEGVRKDYMRVHDIVSSFNNKAKISKENEKKSNISRTEIKKVSTQPILEDKELSTFQLLMLKTLSLNIPYEEMLNKLLKESPASFKKYLETCEIRCIEVASILVKKWLRWL